MDREHGYVIFADLVAEQFRKTNEGSLAGHISRHARDAAGAGASVIHEEIDRAGLRFNNAGHPIDVHLARDIRGDGDGLMAL